mgnify:CR=1 FL=1
MHWDNCNEYFGKDFAIPDIKKKPSFSSNRKKESPHFFFLKNTLKGTTDNIFTGDLVHVRSGNVQVVSSGNGNVNPPIGVFMGCFFEEKTHRPKKRRRFSILIGYRH